MEIIGQLKLTNVSQATRTYVRNKTCFSASKTLFLSLLSSAKNLNQGGFTMKKVKIFIVAMLAILALASAVIPISAMELLMPAEQNSQEVQPFALFGFASCPTAVCNVLMFSTSTTINDRDIVGRIPNGSRVIMDSATATNRRIFVGFNGTWGWVNANLITGIQWQ